MSIRVTGNTIKITTTRLSATFDGPDLIELRSPQGALLAVQTGSRSPSLTLGFANGEYTPLCIAPYAQVAVVKLGERIVHIHASDENGDACLRLMIDKYDRLVIEPSAHTIRRNLASITWRLPGIMPEYKLVAPFYQGCRQDLEHPLVAGKNFEWPSRWEAAIVMLQGFTGGFSVAANDRNHHPKAISIGNGDTARSLSFHTMLNGPAHDTVAVGSLQWVVDTHEGGWQVPAGSYRDWLQREVGAAHLRTLRPAWASEIRLALQWANNNLEVLDAVAKIIAPEKVLIHQSAWRADPYDVNYPEYTASKDGAAYIAKGRAMGFHVMPHFNFFAIDPNHPAFPSLTDFIAREFGTQRLMAWRWKNNQCPPPPQAFGTLASLRDEKLMYYLHTGASAWRHLLAERIAAAAAQHQLSAVFVDQTLCTWNLENALVEDLTPVEGMVALTKALAELDGPLAVGGEGLNEMSMRYQTFAQAHLFESHHTSNPHFSELDPVPVCNFLFGDLCKTMGYANIAGDTPESIWRLEVHERLGALPSLIVRHPEDVLKPNPAVQRVLNRAIAS